MPRNVPKRSAAAAALSQTSGETRRQKLSPSKLRERAASAQRQNNNGGKINRKYTHPSDSQLDEHGNIVNQSHFTTRDNSVVTMRSQTSSPQENCEEIQQTRSVKPVFIETAINVVKNKLSSFNLKEPPTLKILNKNKTIQVNCSSLEDKNKLMEGLKTQQFRFYTFSEPNDKPMIYVLKGMDDMKPEELQEMLLNSQVPAKKVSLLIENHYGSPIYLVSFDRTSQISLNALQQTRRSIDRTIVRWERFNRANKRLTQCRKCQLFGHSALNCNREYRCVKCDDKHLPGECLRKSREEGKPKCVNCGGDHTANSSTCEHYINYRQRVEKKRSNRHAASNFIEANMASLAPSRNLRQPAQTRMNQMRNQGQSSAAPWTAMSAAPVYDSHFPSLSPNSKEQLRPNVSTNLNATETIQDLLAQAQKDLQSIPNILNEVKAFAEFASALKNAKDVYEQRTIMFNFLMPSQNFQS